MAPNAHQTILTDSVKPEDLDVVSLFDINGRVAVVTGGGTGLGLVTAQTLAQNGCKVYISGRRLGVLEKAAEFKPSKGNGQIIAIQADLNSKEAILEFRRKIEAQEKYINILVNNHGVYLSDVPLSKAPQTAQGLSDAALESETFESWNETYSINVTSVHFATFAFLPLLAAAKEIGGAPEPGNVINLSSISGFTHTAQGGQFSYNSSKAAVAHLSRMMATEFSRRGLGIRVNVIAPGYFPSGMSTSDFMQHGFGQEDHWLDVYGIPLRRVGNAVDYAQLVLGLFANKYITGNTISIDGGWLLKQDPAPYPCALSFEYAAILFSTEVYRSDAYGCQTLERTYTALCRDYQSYVTMTLGAENNNFWTLAPPEVKHPFNHVRCTQYSQQATEDASRCWLDFRNLSVTHKSSDDLPPAHLLAFCKLDHLYLLFMNGSTSSTPSTASLPADDMAAAGCRSTGTVILPTTNTTTLFVIQSAMLLPLAWLGLRWLHSVIFPVPPLVRMRQELKQVELEIALLKKEYSAELEGPANERVKKIRIDIQHIKEQTRMWAALLDADERS